MNFNLVKTNIDGKKLINFLHPKLCPKVTPNPFAFEGYEAENLISSDSMVRSRGFLVGAGKTTTADIEFEFVCNVNINYVKMVTVVGEQRCTGIEIFSKPDRNSPYVSIARSIYDKPGVLFCNSRFYKSSNALFEEERDKEICYFKSNTFNVFLNAAFLKIVIFRTPCKSPCMGSVEVWGLPARSCSKVTVETVLKIVDNSCSTNIQVDTQCGTNNAAGNSQSSEDFKIPSDFQDDLTYEIMTLPMTLPSGNTIDQTTLHKHIESEKSFGRKPGDPFTGKKFTNTCGPILNVALKSRIDMFLTQNAHRKETHNLARTLGSVHSNSASVFFRDTFNSALSSGNKRKLTNSECDNEATSSKILATRKQCGLCEQSGNLYAISTCDHVYCRQCILKVCDSLECCVCKMKFKRENVTKYYP